MSKLLSTTFCDFDKSNLLELRLYPQLLYVRSRHWFDVRRIGRIWYFAGYGRMLVIFTNILQPQLK